MGADRVTVQNLRILRRDPAQNLLLIQGAIPGGENGLIIISRSAKRPGVVKKPQAFQVAVEEEEAPNKNAKAAATKKK